MDEESILTITVFIVLFALVSGRLQRGVLTPPMVFTAFGLLISPYVLLFQKILVLSKTRGDSVSAEHENITIQAEGITV